MTFYLTGANASYGSVNIANGVTVTLSAPTSGTYDGLLFFQNRSIYLHETHWQPLLSDYHHVILERRFRIGYHCAHRETSFVRRRCSNPGVPLSGVRSPGQRYDSERTRF